MNRSRVTPNTCVRDNIRLLNHTFPLSPDLQDHRMHHPTRTATMTDVTATKIRVGRFEMPKHASSSATKNITILSYGFEGKGNELKEGSVETGDLRPHQQCPGKTENNGHRFQAESRVGILVKVDRLSRFVELCAQIRRCSLLTAPTGSSFCLERLWRTKRRPITILPTLASIDM